MKLYYSNSVCSLAVRVILNELNLSCDYEAVNLKTKQMECGSDFLEINPKGSVPVLILNTKEVLTENSVILQYLADTYNASNLLPSIGTLDRYRTLEWLNFISTDLHRYCAPLFWSKITDDTKQNLFLPILIRKLSIVNSQLQDNTFLMGNSFTVADSYLLVILVWLTKLKISLNEWPNLSRYFSDLKQRPSVKQSLEAENLVETFNRTQ